MKFDLGISSGLREAFAESYSKKNFIADIQAGLIVGIVAIPLGMALAIAVGVPPQYGLYTVIGGGAIIALLGGSRFQISGPTAAFVVLLLPVVQKFGFSGLLVAGFLAGFIQFIIGLSGFGQIIRFVPHPVTTGFTSGIALVIASLQLKDFFGLRQTEMPASFAEAIGLFFSSIESFRISEAAVGLLSLGVLIFAARYVKKIPAPLFMLVLITPAAFLLHGYLPQFEPDSILSRFGGIPSQFPEFNWPWLIGDLKFEMSLAHIREILPISMAIAALGAIESLLSAVVADSMTEKTHNPNAELMALGIGNMICPFFGGIPATGAIARTSTNIRFGAVSPIAALFHCVTVLLAMLFLGSLISWIPMASLAALLLFVAWNMSERENFLNILRKANWEDKSVLLVCFGLTAIFDMTIGVGVGVILSCLLFIRRTSLMAQMQTMALNNTPVDSETSAIPSDVLYYRIAGPLFFGVAYRAADSITRIPRTIRIVILDLTQVNWIDSTGSLALDSSLKKLIRSSKKVYLCVPDTMVKSHIRDLEIVESKKEQIRIFKTFDEALAETKRET